MCFDDLGDFLEARHDARAGKFQKEVCVQTPLVSKNLKRGAVISPTGPACRAAPAGAADVVDGSGASVIMSGDPEVRALAARVEAISTKLDVASKSHESSLAVLTSLAQKVDHISEMLQGGVGAKGMPNGAMTLHRRGSAASAGNAVEQTVKEQRDAKRRENMLNKMAKEEVFGVTVGEKAAESKKFAKLQLAFLRKGIVLPTGRFRQTWDSTFLCAIIYIVLLFPYRIAFVTEQSMAYAVIDFILDLFFLADIPLNFCTAFYEPDTNILVTNHRRIAKHYSKTWLLPDVVASIPYDWFISGVRLSSSSVFDGDGDSGVAAQLPQVLRTIRCIKLIRLLRVAGVGRRLEKIVERFSLEVILNNDVLHLLGIAGFMTLFAQYATQGLNPRPLELGASPAALTARHSASRCAAGTHASSTCLPRWRQTSRSLMAT